MERSLFSRFFVFLKKRGEKMDKINNNGEEVGIFENNIDYFISDFCDKYEIDDMAKEPQSRWNAALMYVRKNAFPTGMPKYKTPHPTASNTVPGLNRSNCNMYDYDVLNEICDYYIYKCLLYNKEVSIVGFSNLTGIYTNTINEWNIENNYNNSIDYSNKLSTSRNSIYQKLVNFNEESLSNLLISGTRQPVGIIAALNRRHGWSSPYSPDANKRAAAMENAPLPKLGTASGGSGPAPALELDGTRDVE